MNIYVGNLSYKATEEDLRTAFEPHGHVTAVSIIMDKVSGKSKGFGFVEMSNKSEGEAAISQLDGAEFQGRKLRVNEARPREDRGGGGGGDRGGSRSGGGDRGRSGGYGGGSNRW